jgi:hypothetical protein
LESFSYALQFDMHFYMHSYVDKNLILVKSGCYTHDREHDCHDSSTLCTGCTDSP